MSQIRKQNERANCPVLENANLLQDLLRSFILPSLIELNLQHEFNSSIDLNYTRVLQTAMRFELPKEWNKGNELFMLPDWKQRLLCKIHIYINCMVKPCLICTQVSRSFNVKISTFVAVYKDKIQCLREQVRLLERCIQETANAFDFFKIIGTMGVMADDGDSDGDLDELVL